MHVFRQYDPFSRQYDSISDKIISLLNSVFYAFEFLNKILKLMPISASQPKQPVDQLSETF